MYVAVYKAVESLFDAMHHPDAHNVSLQISLYENIYM